MIQNERKKELVKFITDRRSVKLDEIAERFGVSVMTIRRDLLQLEKQGFLTINRGVAHLNVGTALELSTSLKNNQNAKEKKRIAKEAAKLIEEGSTIYLDYGTTVNEIAYEINTIKNITVVTGSLLVINILCNFPNIKLHVTPGTFCENNMGFIDSSTYGYLNNIYVDIAFLGAESVDERLGFMVPGSDDAQCKRSICSHSKKVVVLADSSKMGNQSTFIYAPANRADILITDNRCSADVIRQWNKKAVEVILA